MLGRSSSPNGSKRYSLYRNQRMLLPSILLLLGVSLSANGRGDFLERRPELSEYQDAWKSLVQPGRYYLYQRTYELDPFLGRKSKCANSVLEAVEEKNNLTINTVGYWDERKEKMVTMTAYATVKTTEGYPKPDIITASLVRGGPEAEYPVVYTEYDNCEIFRVTHANNGCELWVKEGKTDKVSSPCKFVFDTFCGAEKYQIYDHEFCKDRVPLLQRNGDPDSISKLTTDEHCPSAAPVPSDVRDATQSLDGSCNVKRD